MRLLLKFRITAVFLQSFSHVITNKSYSEIKFTKTT